MSGILFRLWPGNCDRLLPVKSERKFWKFLFPAIFLLLSLLIIIEGATPGNESSAHSKIFAVIFDRGPKEAKIIRPLSFSMEQENYELTVGDTMTLNVTFDPIDTTDQRVSYSVVSGGESVSLSKNSISGVKEGRAKLLATSVASPDLTCSFSVQVNKKQIHSLKGKLTTEARLIKGMTSKLEVQSDKTPFSLDEITFISTDPEVLLVEPNGIIRTIKEGNAEVYAYSNENEDIRTAPISINVVLGNFVPTTSIAYEEEMTMPVNGKKTIAPEFNEGCSDTAFVLSSDSSAVHINGHNIVPKKEGSYRITMTSINNPEVQSSFLLKATEVKPLSIEVSFSSIQYGKTTKLPYTLISEEEGIDVTYPDVLFSTSDSSIATIDKNGYLIGLKKGSVDITVSWKKNTEIKGVATIAITAMDGVRFDRINYLIRKLIGHFGSFLVTAVFGILTVFLFSKETKRRSLLSLAILIYGFVLAMLSEFLQIFAGNRGPSFTDVGIDFSGYFIGALLTFLLCLFLFRKKDKEKAARIKGS